MEVVLLLVVLTGIALIVVPRMQRRRAAGKRPAPAKRQRQRRGRAAAVAAPAVATTTWTPAGDDGWDDDLGWEGVEEPAPETREAWERWRETESPLAANPEPEPDQPRELPSVERWRAASSEEADWVGDDDGLGWEGESEPVTTNGNGASNGNGHAEPAIVLSAFATAADAPVGARAARPQEHEEFNAPTGRQWSATNGAAAPAVAAPRRQARMHPVVLVAIYAAAGIGLVVLISTALLGGSSDPAPAPAVQKTTPAVKPAAPAVAPVVQDTAAQDAAAAEKAEAAAAARKAEDASAGAQTKAERSHDSQVSKARADKRRRDREKKSDSAGSPPATTPPSGTSSSGGGTYVPPRAPVVCEFCIG